MNPSTIVVDTNVLISAVLSPNGTAKKAFVKAIAYFQLIQSQSTYEELVTRLQKKKFDKYISLEDRKQFLERVKLDSYFLTVEVKTMICSDPDDNKFLDLASMGKAIYLLTGDQDLLTLDTYENTRIIQPALFLEMILV
ncbi:MAG: putative toxin-antitoxin system toxin component, PIN family [Synechocystis sp.]